MVNVLRPRQCIILILAFGIISKTSIYPSFFPCFSLVQLFWWVGVFIVFILRHTCTFLMFALWMFFCWTIGIEWLCILRVSICACVYVCVCPFVVVNKNSSSYQSVSLAGSLPIYLTIYLCISLLPLFTYAFLSTSSTVSNAILIFHMLPLDVSPPQQVDLRVNLSLYLFLQLPP